jgi:hypothetical protein
MDVAKHQNRVYNEFGFLQQQKILNILAFFRDEFIYGGHWLSLSASCNALSLMLLLRINVGKTW